MERALAHLLPGWKRQATRSCPRSLFEDVKERGPHKASRDDLALWQQAVPRPTRNHVWRILARPLCSPSQERVVGTYGSGVQGIHEVLNPTDPGASCAEGHRSRLPSQLLRRTEEPLWILDHEKNPDAAEVNLRRGGQ